MQKLVELRKRMDTVHNIQSITRALATVSSAKLSRTRARAAGMRLYVMRMREVLQRQQAEAAARGIDLTPLSPFMQPKAAVNNIVLVHFAGDRGMCGSYNLSANREALRFIEEQQALGRTVTVLVKGTRGERFIRKRVKGCEVVSLGTWSSAGVPTDEVADVYDRISDLFLTNAADEIHCCYTQFYSPLRRVPRVVRLLPVAADTLGARTSAASSDGGRGWFYEPDFESLVAEIVSLFLLMQVEDVLLESFASEQGARMITMEEASERADKTLADLGVSYNRLRREVITIDLISVLFASKMRTDEEAALSASSGRH